MIDSRSPAMSQLDTEHTQPSLASAAEIVIPSTPPRMLSASPELLSVGSHHAEPMEKTATKLVTSRDRFCSPLPVSSSEMTPPPSSQTHASLRRRSRSSPSIIPDSPPESMDKTLCAAYGASENLPTVEDIEAANEPQLRVMAQDLLNTTKEARMSALHFKLQNSLISFASTKAIKRAEVEQQLARREVEILQSSEYRNRHTVSQPRTPELSPNPRLDTAFKRIEELETINTILDRRLRSAKKLIRQEKNKVELRDEEITLLKQRIRDNREHFSRMFDHGSLNASPRTAFQTPQRKGMSRYPDSARSQVGRGSRHDAFAALLAADQVLSAESASVTSTPSQNRFPKPPPAGRARGSHSLSSFPVTPERRQLTYDPDYIAPGRPLLAEPPAAFSGSSMEELRAERERHDRDSTISVSDAEEALTDEDIPMSQASSLATSLLRRFPGSSQEDTPSGGNIGKQSTLLQAKLFGHVKKVSVESTHRFQKRKASIDEDHFAGKKARLESVGLGIDSWNVPRV